MGEESETGDTDSRRTATQPATDDRFSVPLRGVAVGPETRCLHWDGPADIVALRFGCCEAYYPCDACHDATTDHDAEPWPRDRFDASAALCGVCGATLSAHEYLAVDDGCPRCDADFNPGCRAHRDRYFEE